MERACSIEGCLLPHHAKGMCRSHYRQTRYATIPEVRDKKLAYGKDYRMENAEKVYAKSAEWRKKNKRKARRISRDYVHRQTEKNGYSQGTKCVPGRPCEVEANGGPVRAKIGSLAFREGNRWRVGVELPWGEIVHFDTKEIRL